MSKESDVLAEAYNALAEAYTKLNDIATAAFYDTKMDGDVSQFLRTIATQINLYRVTFVKGEKA